MSPRLKAVAAVLLISASIIFFRVWQNAHAALQAGEQIAAHAGEVNATLAPWHPSASAFEPVDLGSGYNSSVEFNGDTYKLAPGSLTSSTRVWHVGRDLPSARLLSLAVRVGAAAPELWIATDGAGVLLYDGQFFRQLLPRDVALRKISALLPLRNGHVLIGTPTAGLYVSDGKTLRVFHPDFASTQITALAGDEDEFWVGTRGDGAWQWRGGIAQHVSKELLDSQVLSLATAGDTAWVGTALGITEFRSGRFRRHLGQGLFAASLTKEGDTLRVVTIDQGTQVLPLSPEQPRPQRFESAEASATAPAQHITALHHDDRGNLWVGYFDRGLDIVSRAGIDHREDDHLFCINRIREHNGAMAVATANGLVMFDAMTRVRQVLDRNTGLIASQVNDVLFANDSAIVATPAGLSFLDHGISSIQGFHGLVNNHVFTLAEWNGTLYAGTLGGVSKVQNGLVQASFTTANSQLRQNWITASEKFGGKLYLGTYGSGVVEFQSDGTVVPSPSFAKTRTEVNLNAMLSTTRALYAGTSGQGLAMLLPGQDRWRFIGNGLPSTNVTALAIHNGTLYIGTDNGLVQVAEEKLRP